MRLIYSVFILIVAAIVGFFCWLFNVSIENFFAFLGCIVLAIWVCGFIGGCYIVWVAIRSAFRFRSRLV